MRALLPAIYIMLLAWGTWYLWYSLRKGEAPGPPFGVAREDHPLLFWINTLAYAAVLAILLFIGWRELG